MMYFRAISIVGITLSFFVILGVTWLRTSLPKTTGTVFTAGISDEIRIQRDRHGIPHITGATDPDAYFGLGYAHAQDRLWQMEISRRAGAGRLSEIFGERTLYADKYLRGLGLYHAAEASLLHFSDTATTLIQSYSDGINAFLLSHKGALPIEFIVFNHRPELWKASDSIVCAKMMAHQLGGNAGDELLRHQLLKILTNDQINELWGIQKSNGQVGMSNSRKTEPHHFNYSIPYNRHMVGSNNWAINGKHTKSKKPILASDPHLGLTAPSPWYLAHIQSNTINIAGGTLPGIPVIIIGRNQEMAWGVTNTGPDVQDLFLERVSPTNKDAYLTPDGISTFVKRKEIIKIKDGPDQELIVRQTRHGPVISDFSNRYNEAQIANEVIAISWTALSSSDTTLQAGFNLANSISWSDFTSALQDFIAPQQNFVAAHVNGDIGFIAPGKIPNRKTGNGWLPTQGWTGFGDWVGEIPYNDLPTVLNPTNGVIVTANQDITTGKQYPYFISQDWASTYRFDRITNLLTNPDYHSIDGFKHIQTDIISLMARDFKPWILLSKFSPKLEKQLESWDGSMEKSAIEPLIFHAWYRELTKLIYADELGDIFDRSWERRPKFVLDTLKNHTIWCDDITTETRETCEIMIAKARINAITWLSRHYGEDPEAWKWEGAHIARHKHAAFSGTPLLGTLFDITHPHDGGPYTVMQANTTLRNEEKPFEENHGAALRAIFDLSHLDNTHVMISTGQSGNRLSRHYSSFSKLWTDGKYVKLPMSSEEIQKVVREQLILLPNP